MSDKTFKQKKGEVHENSVELLNKCPYCDGKDTKKRGKAKSGAQRYLCNNCKKSFVDTVDYSDFYISTADENCLHAGVDYLRIAAAHYPDESYFDTLNINNDEEKKEAYDYHVRKFEEIWGLFDVLNDTNSSHYTLELFDDEIGVSLTNGSYLKFMYNDHEIMQFHKPTGVVGQAMNARGQYWVIDIYGMFFTLCGLSTKSYSIFNLKTLNFFCCLANINFTSRLDFCIDIAGLNVDEVVKKIKHKNKDICIFQGKNGKKETFYIGKKTSKNKYGIIRIYDKKKDIHAKNKHEFYPHYLNDERDVTRFEVELRANFLNECGFKPEDIFDEKKLMNLFNTFVNSKNIQTTMKFEGATKLKRNYRQFQKAAEQYWNKVFDRSVQRCVNNGPLSPWDLIGRLASIFVYQGGQTPYEFITHIAPLLQRIHEESTEPLLDEFRFE